MKGFLTAIALALSLSAMAEMTPEQARADIKSLLNFAVIKGEVIDTPTHRYNVTLFRSETAQDLTVAMYSPLYEVSHGLVRERGSEEVIRILIGNNTYMIRKTEAVQGGLTVVTYKLRNRRSLEYRGEFVSKQELQIFTRANGRLVRIIAKVEEPGDGYSYSRIFEPKEWQHPTRL